MADNEKSEQKEKEQQDVEPAFYKRVDKIGLQLINITAGRIFTHELVVLLEPKVQPIRMLKSGLTEERHQYEQKI